jgi:hypothetical protein
MRKQSISVCRFEKKEAYSCKCFGRPACLYTDQFLQLTYCRVALVFFFFEKKVAFVGI